MKKLLTADEVADILSVTPRAVRHWAQTGVIPAVRIGRVVRFDPDAVNRVIGGHTVGARGAAASEVSVRSTRASRLAKAVSARLSV